MRFSKTTQGFYPETEHYPSLPDDLITITEAEYQRATHLNCGETLDVVNGQLVIVPAPVPDPAEVLAKVKANGLGRISDWVQSKRALIAGTPDAVEMVGWNHKLRIAQAIVAGTASADEQATFQAEINARGISGETLDSFCQKVLQKAARFAQAVGLIDGYQRKAQDAVAAATTPEDVHAAVTALQLAPCLS